MNRASAQNVLVSTTPRLEGWEIKKYLGTASAHVVAGTNIFSDIAASWRDVFGGQSKSYKKQLEQINERVVDELREEASTRGGNALVGLQIDHDQISGQNKEMFMVTATGTAVRAESLSESSSARDEGAEGPITASEVSVEEETVRLRRKSQDGSLRLDDENWRFLIENRVSDFAGDVQVMLANIIESPGGASPSEEKHLQNGRDYFLSISREKAKGHLYDMASRRDLEVMGWAVDVLEDGDMLDFGRIETMLGGRFHTEQKPALEVLSRADKPYYKPEDIERLKVLRSQVKLGFEKRGEVLEVEENGMMSSGTKKVWQIRGRTHNPMEQKYCSETGLDIYGFGKDETRPEEAARALDTKIEALNQRFGDS